MILTIIIATLCILDLVLTFYYVYKYKKWQPNKPYNLIELNPLLVFLWNKFGLITGMIIGGLIILFLNIVVSIYSHWSIILILLLALCFVMYKHFKNIKLLNKLIKQYPTGYLPEEKFGEVIGNNVTTKI